MARSYESVSVDLPGGQRSPLRHIAVRLAIALGLIAFVALLTYFGRSGYADPSGGRSACSTRSTTRPSPSRPRATATSCR